MIRSIISGAARKGIKGIEKKILSKHVSIEVAELFFQHNGRTDFKRYDMIVRLLAVENYFGKNDYGFDFYRRMQAARIGIGNVSEAVNRFLELIKSYEEKGYDDKSEIELDKNLHLIDGSHRMAMAMYYQLPRIKAVVRPRPDNVFYGIEWFAVNGFNEKEIKILTDKYNQLKEYYSTPFVCSLWSPVHEYYDELLEKLRLFGEVTEVQDFELSQQEYDFYTRGIYHVDDIAKWKIEKKIQYMHQSSPHLHRIRMVCLNLAEPNFRLKGATLSTLSVQCELIKKLIRDAYKTKVNNYFHDIILHIGDNFYQNRHIYRLLTMHKIDLAGILKNIKGRKYVINKFETPYMPKDFPVHYALGKDLDILCTEEEHEKIVESILNDVEQYKSYYSIRIVDKTDASGKRILVRLELEDRFLVFQFDIAAQYRTGSGEPDLMSEVITTRQEKNGFYIPQTKYELLLRLKELKDYPEKKHHLAYIQQHKSELDEHLANKFLSFDWRKFIK